MLVPLGWSFLSIISAHFSAITEILASDLMSVYYNLVQIRNGLSSNSVSHVTGWYDKCYFGNFFPRGTHISVRFPSENHCHRSEVELGYKFMVWHTLGVKEGNMHVCVLWPVSSSRFGRTFASICHSALCGFVSGSSIPSPIITFFRN